MYPDFPKRYAATATTLIRFSTPVPRQLSTGWGVSRALTAHARTFTLAIIKLQVKKYEGSVTLW